MALDIDRVVDLINDPEFCPHPITIAQAEGFVAATGQEGVAALLALAASAQSQAAQRDAGGSDVDR